MVQRKEIEIFPGVNASLPTGTTRDENSWERLPSKEPFKVTASVDNSNQLHSITFCKIKEENPFESVANRKATTLKLGFRCDGNRSDFRLPREHLQRCLSDVENLSATSMPAFSAYQTHCSVRSLLAAARFTIRPMGLIRETFCFATASMHLREFRSNPDVSSQ